MIGAGEPPAQATYVEPNILEAAGLIIDTITDIKILPTSNSELEVLETLRALAPASLKRKLYVAGGTTLDAYCRTFFANEFTKRYKPAGELLNFQNYADALQLLDESPNSDPQRIAHFVKDFRIQTFDRVLAISELGYLALVPKESRPGDILGHILGSRWPFVLRLVDDAYMVVGFAYVDGDNDREAFLGPYPEGSSGVALYDAPTGKWWPMTFNEVTKQSQIEDPRLGPLPQGWSVKPHKESKLWNWYVKDDEEVSGDIKQEIRLRSDPRLKVDALKARGVAVSVLKLV